ncbi:MAG: hypothetical protein HQ582_23315 [Planctomycetes bacterium]|nr:hypothetical protein [Planctomycetota bacterium]
MSSGLVMALCAALLAAPGAGLAGDQPATVQRHLIRAFKAAQEVEEGDAREYALGAIGLTMAYSGDIGSARAVVRQIKTAREAGSVLAAIGHVQVKQGDRAGAKKTLAEAAGWAKQTEWAQPGAVLLHSIIRAHLAGQQYEEATQLASTFPGEVDRGFARIDIIEAYADAGRLGEARSELRKLTATFSRSLDPVTSGIWKQMCQLHLKMNDVDEALKLAREIPKQHYLASKALREVARHQSESGDGTAAAKTLAEAFQVAGQIEGERGFRELHMGWTVQTQVELGDLAGALGSLEEIPDGVSKAKSMGHVAVAQAKAGDRSTAKATLERAVAMVEADPWDNTLALLAVSQASIGESAAARITIGKALEAARKRKSELRFRSVAAAQIEMGDRAAAKETLDEIARLARTGRWANAAETIARAQIDAGFYDAAGVTVREILLPAIPHDDEYARSNAIVLLAKAGDFTNAYEATRKRPPMYQVIGIRTVAAYHTLARGPEPPAALAGKETDPLVRSVLHLGIALGLLKKRGVEVRAHDGPPLIDDV